MIKVISFKKLRGNSKKYEIIFEKNGKKYTRKFGAAGMSDYTIHKDKERRERYISRHKKDLRTGDPMKPGYLSMYILWNKPSVKTSLADYKRRLNVYNKTGKFPKAITGSKKLSFGGKESQFGTVKKMKEYQDITDFLRDKTGRDPSIDFIEPQLKKNLRDYSASKISATQRGKNVRAGANTKKNLKSILWNLNAKYESAAEANEQMGPGGRPWIVLNPGKKETTKWLFIAADTLTPKDFDDDELWYNTLKHVLDEIVDMEPGTREYGPNIQANLTASIDNIEIIMQKIGYYIDFDNQEWYNLAYGWLTEEWVSGNAFGKKYKLPDNVVNKKLYSNIKSKIKRSIKGRRWGAYDSGRLVREYKAKGGKYTGSKGKSNLSRWYKEKWVDACSWPKRKSCGRKTKKSIAYCRPSKKVDSKTPKLVQKLTASQLKSRCARKKKAPMKRITKFGVEIPPQEIRVGYNPRRLPVKSPTHYSYNKFGDKKKLRQDMYNNIILGPNKDMGDNVMNALIKRCPNALSPRLENKECSKRMTELILSIYFTMIKDKSIKLNTKRKRKINTMIKSMSKVYDIPSMLKLRKKYLINELLTGLQGGYYGKIFQGELSNYILESIIT